jgi:syntaxin 1B/2/3
MNRLAGLQEGSASVHVRSDSAFSESGQEMTSKPADDDENPLEKFYSQVSEIQGIVRDIQSLTQSLKQKHGEKMQIIDASKATAAADEITEMTEKINQLAKKGNEKLSAISKGTAELKKTPEDEQNNAGIIKIQQNQHAHLLKMYMNAVQEYQAAQKENEKAYVDQTTRQIMTKMREADGSTISEGRAQELALEAIEQGTENGLFQQSKDTLARIIETRNDIYRIEQSMRELNQLFQDLAVLVNEQQEAMDNILVNVQNSVKYVEKGREELAKAKKYAKKGRKKFCWLLVVAVVVFIFILAIVLGATI